MISSETVDVGAESFMWAEAQQVVSASTLCH